MWLIALESFRCLSSHAQTQGYVDFVCLAADPVRSEIDAPGLYWGLLLKGLYMESLSLFMENSF